MRPAPCKSKLLVLVLLGLLPGCGSAPPAGKDPAPTPEGTSAAPPAATPSSLASVRPPAVEPKTQSPSPSPEKAPATTSSPLPPAGALAHAADVARQLDEALRPAEHALPLRPDKRKLLAGPQELEQPRLPPPRFSGLPPRPQPRLPTPELTSPSLPEEPPPQVDLTGLPMRLLLPVQPLAREPAPDPNQVPPLPLLARPAPDGDFSDPLADYNQGYLQAVPAPQRTGPLPFDRPSVPDPFIHRHAVQLEAPPAEAPLPPQLLPRLPARLALPGS